MSGQIPDDYRSRYMAWRDENRSLPWLAGLECQPWLREPGCDHVVRLTADKHHGIVVGPEGVRIFRTDPA